MGRLIVWAFVATMLIIGTMTAWGVSHTLVLPSSAYDPVGLAEFDMRYYWPWLFLIIYPICLGVGALMRFVARRRAHG